METTHPTPDERFFFDTNGYLVLEGLLPDGLVSDLTHGADRGHREGDASRKRGATLWESRSSRGATPGYSDCWRRTRRSCT